jgi:LIVCS family branched-chain amino acid:cation transporter
MYGPYVTGASEPQLLSALASTILGPNAGILANLSVIVACFATALALTAVFADYLHKEILREKLNYTHALLITIITEFSITNLGFMGIIKVTAPILNLCYPALIALAISNIATAIYGFRHTKIVFFTTLFITAIVQYSDYIVALLKG